MISNSSSCRQPILLSMLILILAGCSPRTGKEMAHVEEDYMKSKYKDKMERPSPPARAETRISNSLLSIEYSQPGVKGREIWGKLVKFNKIWRTGANEANVFETEIPLVFEEDTLPAGKYSLFTIPSEDKWIVILNRVHDQWGTYNYTEKEDALRLEVWPYKVDDLTERMTFAVDSSGKINFAWEYLRFDIDFKAIASI